uniref:Uncharacterized protein n=1 Tax=Lotus japonicus TaxID=34305 RepID=I3SQY5_LOTJA|nr:unknown [Lotus japonicus]
MFTLKKRQACLSKIISLRLRQKQPKNRNIDSEDIIHPNQTCVSQETTHYKVQTVAKKRKINNRFGDKTSDGYYNQLFFFFSFQEGISNVTVRLISRSTVSIISISA